MAISSPPSISDVIKRAVREDARSLSAIARAAQVEPAALSRFLRGRTGMVSPYLDRLAVVVGVVAVAN